MIFPPYIAIVDDDETVGKALKRVLRHLNFEVRVFSSGQLFLGAVSESLPVVAIFDVQMPEISGLDLQERLLAEERNIPILFITASDDAELRRQALANGAVGFIGKPFKRQEILELVQKACNVEQPKPQGLKLRLQSPVLDWNLTPPVLSGADLDMFDLKPCPFCRAHPRLDKISVVDARGRTCFQARVACPNCTAEVSAETKAVFSTSMSAVNDAMKRWNRRQALPS